MHTSNTPTPFQDKLAELSAAKRAIDREIDAIALAALCEFVRELWPEAGILRADVDHNVCAVMTVDGSRVLASIEDFDEDDNLCADWSDMTDLVANLPIGQRGMYSPIGEYAIALESLHRN